MLLELMASHSVASLGACQERRRWIQALPACGAAAGGSQPLPLLACNTPPLLAFAMPPSSGPLVEALGLSHPTACCSLTAVM